MTGDSHPSAPPTVQPAPLPRLLRWLQSREFPHQLGICDRLFGRALARYGIAWVRTAPGLMWKLDLANQTHRWIVYGWYEGPSFWRWFEARRQQMRTIVDSGANIGQTVLYFAALVPQARVLAYEPGKLARDWLIESVRANDLVQVSVESFGLGAAAGPAFLTSVGAQDRHGSWNQVSETEGEPIVLRRLDDEMARHQVATVDLWKVDMEGYEIVALRGATSALAEGRIRAIYIEAAGETGEAALAFLREHGYRVHALTDSGGLVPWRENFRYENALCLAPGTDLA